MIMELFMLLRQEKKFSMNLIINMSDVSWVAKSAIVKRFNKEKAGWYERVRTVTTRETI